ncbi:MAG: hypothetical protein DHS20C15_29460 [Planctomycetota bacterium]|nr:MAG: hypothetical protein DHS20C15_29460 [Planctomycetota bacterium]
MGKWGLAATVALIVVACWWLLRPDDTPVDDSVGALAQRDDAALHHDAQAALPVTVNEPAALAGATSDASDVVAASAASNAADTLDVVSASGRVVDAFGVPLAGAEVLLFPDWRTQRALDFTGALHLGFYEVVAYEPDAFERVLTDSQGRFQLEGPWKRSDGPSSSDSSFPTLLVRADGFALTAFPLFAFAGGAVDVGDLSLAEFGASLRARFVDEQGAPIEGVQVVVEHRWLGPARPASHPPQDAPFFHAQSDADGEWRITHQWRGAFTLRFLATDREELEHEVEVAAGESVDLGTFTLPRAAQVSGRVTDLNGAPVVGARVTAADSDYGAWLPEPGEHDSDFLLANFPFMIREGGVTGEQGHYKLTGLPRAKSPFRVIATADGHEVSWIADVPPDSAGNDLVLRPEARLLVEVVSEASGASIPDFELRAFRDINRWLAMTSPNMKDYLPLPVSDNVVHQAGPIGTRLFVSAPGYTQQLHDAPGLTPGEQLSVRVALRPAHSLRVRVANEVGDPIPGAKLQLTPPAEWGSGFRSHGPRPFAKDRTDAQGLVELHGFAAGDWELTISAEAHKGVHLSRFEIIEGDAEHTFTLQRLASILGRVFAIDGSPAVAQRVIWSPGRYGTYDVLTDTEGRFQLDNVAGGGSLHVARVAALELEIAAGETRELEFHQRALSVVEGRVLDTAGVPIPGVLVQFVGPSQLGPVFAFDNFETGVDGRFHFESELPGDYELHAFRDGVGRAQPLTLRAGDQLEREFVLGDASVSGTVIVDGTDLDVGQLYVRLVQGDETIGSLQPDAKGRFHFAGLSAGSYALRTHGGMSIAESWGVFELAEAESRRGVELRPQHGASIYGHVVHEDGGPFQGYVHLRSADGEHYELAWPRFGSGMFDVRGLHPGAWQLDLAKQHTKSLGAGADGVAGVGEPGVELPFFAREQLNLASGERRTIRLVVPDSAGR